MNGIVINRTWIQGKRPKIEDLGEFAYQGEGAAHTFNISGKTQAGATVEITGTIKGVYLGENNVSVPLTGSVNDGIASITLTDDCYDIPGRFILSIYAQNTETLCIYCGIGHMFRTESERVPGTPISDVLELIDRAQEVIDSIPEDYSELSDDVIELKTVTDPIINAEVNWTDGKYLFVNSSHVVSEQSNEVYACSDYILIPAGMACHVHTWYSGYARTVLYNASKAWLADYQQTSGIIYGVIDIDIAAAMSDRYVRITCHVDKKSKAYIAITEPLSNVVKDVQSLQALSVLAKGSRTSTPDQLASLDNAVPNTVYTFTASVDDETQPSAYGTLLTLNATRDNNGGHAQIFVAWDGKVYSRIKWVRGGVSGFNAWSELARTVEPYQYADATMFERIGVIGDSFASGVIYPSDYSGTQADENYTHYEQSWPQCLGRLCGNTVINYSVGGCTTKTWMTNSQHGKPKMDTEEPCGLYLLTLGINDSNANTGVPLGTIDDIGTSADTFYRWYGEIVEAVKAHAPDALIVFSTYCRIPTAETSANYTAYNNAIKALAEHYEVPCLMLTDDPFFNSNYYMNHMQNSHPTAAQYSGYAKGINRLLARSIVDNYSYYCDYNSDPST